MQVEGGILQVPVSQEQLNGAQVCAGLQHVSREAVAQRVGADPFDDARAQSRFMTGVPHRFVGDGPLFCDGSLAAGEQVYPP